MGVDILLWEGLGPLLVLLTPLNRTIRHSKLVAKEVWTHSSNN